MGKPHILAIPYPAQGHVIPLMELSLSLLKQRKDLGRLVEGIYQVMPGKLEVLINTINASEDEKVTCVIADESMGWALEVAKKMKIRRAVFWPASAAALCLLFSTQKLIDDGIIDNDGTPLKNQIIQLSPTMPAMNTANFIWALIGHLTTRKMIFDLVLKTIKVVKEEDKIICNSAYGLEPGAFTFSPEILLIGPLLASNRLGHTVGNLWPEDPTCLKWLDKQAPRSVIYAAFGSFTIFDKTQFQELALGLELSSRPFLWVVRPDTVNDTNAYPQGFQERVANHGKIVDWAPQQKVLSHPSIAGFLSHCGWNSTMEGVGNGVPFLCWPYFSDQFLDESYICDIWKVGLKFDRNESGIITREEIKNKMEQVVSDENFKARALQLKEIALESVGESGHSNNVFRNFLDWIKA
ncbi:UDP-glucuronosyltransferase, putative [Ricinus communis]|uniref:UDP-glucuronosyltransferase, putative n=1 Tax=Ricinus communis TaxID=3988 RepID=B9SJE0_RICCO|nr:UDP-glucuronosyltransferase, putative [Ricinus communis]